jgi:hypothetical protein
MPKTTFLPLFEKMDLYPGLELMTKFLNESVDDRPEFEWFKSELGLSNDREALLLAGIVLKTLRSGEESSMGVLDTYQWGIRDWEWIHPLWCQWTQDGFITSKRKNGVQFECVVASSAFLQRLFNQEVETEGKNETHQFFLKFNTWMQAAKNKVLTARKVEQNVEDWMHAHPKVGFVRKIKDDWKLEIGNAVALMVLVDQQMRTQSGLPLEAICDTLSDTDSDRCIWKQRLNKDEAVLISQSLVKLGTSIDPFIDEEYKATPLAMKVFYPEIVWETPPAAQEGEGRSSVGRKLSWDTITDEILFFNAAEEQQLNSLGKLLSQSSYQRVTQALSKRKLGKGVTILLYGQPGTGKTASVMQWARKNKRSVFMVDISQIRGKYLGDTERNAKKIFDEYYKWAESQERMPILLFNEADALISKRLDVERSVDMAMNAMQNIFLQEMENFKGILVATTNLNKNMDQAFERRFLWKVEIGHPDTATQERMMWSAFKSDMKRPEVKTLAQQFSLTGGQLMNIRRKFVLETITHPRINRMACLSQLCQQELSYSTTVSRRGIGF